MKKISFALICVAIFISFEVDAGKTILLPKPAISGTFPLEKAIFLRRSIRKYKDTPLTTEQISQLFWAAQGITAEASGFRTAPSAGATYPLEIYGVTKDWTAHYNPGQHSIEIISYHDERKKLSLASYRQSFIAEAPFDLVIASVPQRTAKRYGEKAERYINMEVGHAAQNVHLEAVSLGLGSVPVGAFSAFAVKTLLGLPKDQEPLYIIPVGHPAQ